MTLDQWLRREGLTEAAFAARIGVSHASVNRWRHGISKPDWRHLPVIERETDGAVSVRDFMPAEVAS